MLSWKLYRKVNSVKTWSLRKEEVLSGITSFLPLKFEHANYLFQIQRFLWPFMTLQSIGFKFFAKTIRGSCVFVVQVVLVLTLQAALKIRRLIFGKVILCFILQLWVSHFIYFKLALVLFNGCLMNVHHWKKLTFSKLRFSCLQVSFWGTPTHTDITEF